VLPCCPHCFRLPCCGGSLDLLICTPRKSEGLMIWTTLAPKLTPFGTSGCNANHINVSPFSCGRTTKRSEGGQSSAATACWAAARKQSPQPIHDASRWPSTEYLRSRGTACAYILKSSIPAHEGCCMVLLSSPIFHGRYVKSCDVQLRHRAGECLSVRHLSVERSSAM
jgi:hypothetical protein